MVSTICPHCFEHFNLVQWNLSNVVTYHGTTRVVALHRLGEYFIIDVGMEKQQKTLIFANILIGYRDDCMVKKEQKQDCINAGHCGAGLSKVPGWFKAHVRTYSIHTCRSTCSTLDLSL